MVAHGNCDPRLHVVIPSVWKGLQAMSKAKRQLFLNQRELSGPSLDYLLWAIKIGDSASLVLGVFGMVAFFTAILEPWIIGSRFRKHQLILGCNHCYRTILYQSSQSRRVH